MGNKRLCFSLLFLLITLSGTVFCGDFNGRMQCRDPFEESTDRVFSLCKECENQSVFSKADFSRVPNRDYLSASLAIDSGYDVKSFLSAKEGNRFFVNGIYAAPIGCLSQDVPPKLYFNFVFYEKLSENQTLSSNETIVSKELANELLADGLAESYEQLLGKTMHITANIGTLFEEDAWNLKIKNIIIIDDFSSRIGDDAFFLFLGEGHSKSSQFDVRSVFDLSSERKNVNSVLKKMSKYDEDFGISFDFFNLAHGTENNLNFSTRDINELKRIFDRDEGPYLLFWLLYVCLLLTSAVSALAAYFSCENVSLLMTLTTGVWTLSFCASAKTIMSFFGGEISKTNPYSFAYSIAALLVVFGVFIGAKLWKKR